jgi:hypothetical protein
VDEYLAHTEDVANKHYRMPTVEDIAIGGETVERIVYVSITEVREVDLNL